MEITNEKIMETADRLGTKYGIVLNLFRAGWSYGDIAEEIECSPQTIANMLRRMRIDSY